jgi:drug/metabolite transporter (DMT)-like permease
MPMEAQGGLTPRLLGMLLVSLCLGAAGQSLMKLGMSRYTQAHGDIGGLGHLIQAMLSPAVMAGLGCFVLSSMLYLVLLSKLPMSLLYPMVALNYVFVTILGRFLFAEHVSLLRVGGLAVIIAGVTLVAMSGEKTPGGPPLPSDLPVTSADSGTP